MPISNFCDEYGLQPSQIYRWQAAICEHADIISDNGLQLIAKDVKQFVRFAGIARVRTNPYYPQSDGKLPTCQ